MTELFEPDDRQKEIEDDGEQQYGRDLIVQAFFSWYLLAPLFWCFIG
jgi:hypothetical protein